MKNSLWFPHDFNARSDQKIMELRARYGIEGYGIYWMVIETMASDTIGRLLGGLLGGLSLGYGIEQAKLREVLDFMLSIDLIQECDGGYTCRRIQEFKKERQLFKDAGTKGVRKRWNRGANTPPNTPPIHPPNTYTDIQTDIQTDNSDNIYNMPDSKFAAHFPLFLEWLTRNCQQVTKLPEPITQKQFDTISRKYSEDVIKATMLAMDNYQGLLTKYRSVYKTFLAQVKFNLQPRP